MYDSQEMDTEADVSTDKAALSSWYYWNSKMLFVRVVLGARAGILTLLNPAMTSLDLGIYIAPLSCSDWGLKASGEDAQSSD